MSAVRRRLLQAACLALWAASAAHAAEPPAVLREPALVTPRALGAAMLAVTRAGERLVAAGERGTVLYSDDAGASWKQAQVPVQVSLTALRFVDAKRGVAVGHLGVILKSEDGGASWTRVLDGVRAAQLALEAAQGDAAAMKQAQRLVDEGPDKPFFDVDLGADGHGIAVGAYNGVFVTADGGATWRAASARVPNPKGLHLYGVRRAGRDITIAGEQGLLLRSEDGGASYAALASPYKGSWFGLLTAKSGTLVAYGLRGNVFRSTDRGASWQAVDSGAQVSISAATELPDGTLVLLSQAGDVLTSRDDGATFTRRGASEPLPATGIAPAGNGQLVIASLRGLRRLAATGATGATGVTSDAAQQAAAAGSPAVVQR